MPEASASKLRPAPNGVLLDTLSEFVERPGSEAIAYLLALLLVRRRVLYEEQTMEHVLNEDPATRWSLISPADGRRWSVPLVQPEPSTLPDLQNELTALLFTEE